MSTAYIEFSVYPNQWYKDKCICIGESTFD